MISCWPNCREEVIEQVFVVCRRCEAAIPHSDGVFSRVCVTRVLGSVHSSAFHFAL